MKIYPPGTRIAGRYEIAGRPLMGGMGIVYLCFDHDQGRPVALKTFQPRFLPDRAARDRFLREGTHWVDLGAHPHVVRCYRVLRIDPEVYLVLELVAKEPGREDASLRSWLAPGSPLPVAQALLFGLQIARGMAHATATIPGFVHRDLKPENVLVGADTLSNAPINRLRVTDFGLVRTLAGSEVLSPVGEGEPLPERPGLTRMGTVLGTPNYMAPEQWERTDVDLRADIYALGCILGEMLTSRVLVRERTYGAFKQAHQKGRAREAVMSLPLKTAELLAHCLAVEPGARYRSWGEVEGALGAAYAGVSGRAVPGPEPVGATGREERVAAGWSYSEMGVSYLDIGKAEVALGYFERAREAGRAEGERRLEAAGLNNLGVAYADLGEARRAIAYHEQALAAFREIGDRRGEGNALSGLGIAYAALGDPRQAIGCHEQRLEIARGIGDRRGEGNALLNLGTAYRNLGDARRAIGYLEQALAVAREIENRRGEGQVLGNLGGAYLELGNARQAIGFLKQALAIQREIGNRQGEGVDLGNLGSAYRQLGDARRAIGYYEQQLVITREIGDGRGEGNALMGLGNAYAILGDPQQAIGYWQIATAIFQEIGDVLNAASVGFNLAMLLSQQGRAGEALPYAERAARFFTQIGHAQYAQRAQQLVAQIGAALR